jgi:hypothetical protein
MNEYLLIFIIVAVVVVGLWTAYALNVGSLRDYVKWVQEQRTNSSPTTYPIP